MRLLAVALVWFLNSGAAEPSKAPQNENLRYTVNWPSGLSLGEISWSTVRPGGDSLDWSSELFLEAGVAVFPIRDQYRSKADADLCTVTLEKQVVHGKKSSEETTTFNRKERTALRQTKGGGKTEISTGDCPRDALTFLNHVRKELAAGRIPPQQTVFLGAPYVVKLEYGGQQSVDVSGQRREADRLVGSLKGPASALKFELFFTRDAARTLVGAKVPIALGTIGLELVP